MGAVYSPSLAEATVYGYTFLLATLISHSLVLTALVHSVSPFGLSISRLSRPSWTARMISDFPGISNSNPSCPVAIEAREWPTPHPAGQRYGEVVVGYDLRWPRLVGQLGGLFKVYSDCHSYRQNLLG